MVDGALARREASLRGGGFVWPSGLHCSHPAHVTLTDSVVDHVSP